MAEVLGPARDMHTPRGSMSSAEPTIKPVLPAASATKVRHETREPPKKIKVSQQLPTKSQLEKVGSLKLLKSNGESFTFKSLIDRAGPSRRLLVIFIRHFLCGNCQEYLRSVVSSITPESLAALPVPTELVFVGCGEPQLIEAYAETTSCPFPIYADPTKKLYVGLGMGRSYKLGDVRPSYQQRSVASLAISSIVQGLLSGRNALRGGDFWQIGGEFLFEDGEALWCHRMTNTRDHAEVAELRKRLNLDDTPLPIRNKRWSWTPPAGGNKQSIRRSFSTKRWSHNVTSSEKAALQEQLNKVQEETATKEPADCAACR